MHEIEYIIQCHCQNTLISTYPCFIDELRAGHTSLLLPLVDPTKRERRIDGPKSSMNAVDLKEKYKQGSRPISISTIM
jgi:hypothetical protein